MSDQIKTKFIMGGTNVNVIKMNEGQALDNLPAGVYTVCYSDLTGFFLKINKDMLTLPEKVYGDVHKRVDKCIRTYKERDMSTGILMTGDKGTGKTLFMSLLANTVIEQLNIPIIIVRDAFSGTAFTNFIEDIGECCMVFDEFGKMYPAGNRHENENKQKDLLSLMDGIDKTKRMFLLTENSVFDINDFMLNRPSRIYYHFKYTKLDEASVIGYCEDKDVAKEITDQVVEVCRRSRIFSFDMLQTIVEEHVRFGAAVEDSIADLNIDLKSNEEDMMQILKVINKDTQEECELFEKDDTCPKPNRSTYIRIKADYGDELVAAVDEAPDLPKEIAALVREEQCSYHEIYINDSQLAYQKGDMLVYDADGYVIHAKEMPPKKFNYWAL